MKFYSASEMFVIRMKKLISFLPGTIIFAVFFLLMCIMFVNEEACKAICSDVLTFGLAALAGRVGYLIAKDQYEKECKKQKRQQRTSKRSA